MGWIRRVWDGPFKTPQQESITVGWALLKLLETLWRLLLVVLVMIALLLAYIWQSERSPLSSQVRVELSDAITNTILCQKGYPIFANIRNDSSKNIGEVSLRFRVYPHGKSEDVAVGSFNDLHDILKPRESIQYCFRMPELISGAEGPFTVAAEVTAATELPKDVPVTSRPQLTPPPLVQISGPPLHPPAPPQTIWMKIVGFILVFACLAMFASGGAGLMALCDRLFGTQVTERMRSKKGDHIYYLFVLFCILDLAIVWAGSLALTSLGWDVWETNIDIWSWAHGLQDGGMMLLGALAAQWPWAIWFALNRRSQAEI